MTTAVKAGQRLVSDGVYKYIRHPQYIAVIITITLLSVSSYFNPGPLNPAGGELHDRYWIIIIWAIEIGFYLFLSIIEDMLLRKEFPEQYFEYIQHSWRFFPKFNRIRQIN